MTAPPLLEAIPCPAGDPNPHPSLCHAPVTSPDHVPPGCHTAHPRPPTLSAFAWLTQALSSWLRSPVRTTCLVARCCCSWTGTGCEQLRPTSISCHRTCPQSRAFPQGVILPPGGHLPKSKDIFGFHKGSQWHLMGRSQLLLNILRCTRSPPQQCQPAHMAALSSLGNRRRGAQKA